MANDLINLATTQTVRYLLNFLYKFLKDGAAFNVKVINLFKLLTRGSEVDQSFTFFDEFSEKKN
jgi:hypothetical protein